MELSNVPHVPSTGRPFIEDLIHSWCKPEYIIIMTTKAFHTSLKRAVTPSCPWEENRMLKITWRAPQVDVLDAERLQVGAGLDAGRLSEPQSFFPSSIDHSSGEGGSSDVAAKLLGCVRVQLSQGRRKQGIKRSWKDGESGRTVPPRPDLCRAHRGRTHRRTDMEGSAEEDYKEKLLWNVKREVGVVVWRPVVLHIYIFIVLFNISVHFQITARA